ncbi:MAG: AAA family ATPase [Pyrinomonadaceae bacterium MAG19_C2-C3]|nr:AAA family ATPase [Pyrinomonadaceae bacterium MAG19_C2-C3]
MFRLQKLEITGFKSFADHTELVFTDGITAVVGPNGCGKSNVAEGIAWVLGEQRAKSLRGAEMKDVIFAGTRNRAASGMAEVVLHLVRTDSDEDIEGIGEIDSTLEGIDEESHGEDHAAMLAANAETTDSAMVDSGEATETIDRDARGEASAAMTKARGRRHWRAAKTSLEFAPGETVSVTRRLYRSGESEYLLNNRQCRLRDIQDLFSGTGLSGAHYAIIEQGRIGQILSAKPMDRRVLIEEAAGITKFRVRQRAVEARLEGARGNLNRVADIVSEIERQAGSLRRQAAKARRFVQLRDELRELLRQVYKADYHTLTRTLEDLRGHLAAAHEEEQILVAELAASETAAREATALARESEERLAAERLRASDAMLQRDRQAREFAYKEQQATSLDERLALVRNESLTLRERLTQRVGEAENLRAGEVELRASSEDAARLLQIAEAAYAASLAEVAGVETEIEKLRHELLTHTAVAERLLEIGRQLDAALDRLRFQAEGLEREGERAHTAHETAEREAAELDATMKQSRARLAGLLDEREAATVAITEARGAAHEAANTHLAVQNEYVQVRHRLDALAELDSRRALYSEAVQKLFTAVTDEKNFTHRGTLADELRVEPRYEKAVETIIGAYLQAVIVPTPDDALRAAAWLEANDAGQANFLVTGLRGASGDDEVSASKTRRGRRATTTGNGASATAVLDADDEIVKTSDRANTSDKLYDKSSNNKSPNIKSNGKAKGKTDDAPRLVSLLGASPEIIGVLERALPREMNARIVASLETAMAESLATGATFVTLGGECVMGGALILAGNTLTTDSERDAGLLSFKREMRELEIRVADLESELETAKAEMDAANARVGELEDAVVLLNEVVGRAERDVVQSEMNETRLRADIERAARHLRVVADDTARLAAEIKELEERRHTAERDAQAAQAARQAVTAQVAQVTTALAARRRAAESEGETLSETRAAAATAAERRRAAATDLRRIEVEINDLEHRLERFAAEADTGTRRLSELQAELRAIEANAATYDEQQTAQEQLVEARAHELFEAREQADLFAATLNELHARAAAARDMRSALAVSQAETSARLNYMREACMTELAVSLDELAKVVDDEASANFDVAASRSRIEELRVRIENLGAVNMMALEELAEAEGRLEFLIKQRQDIVDGINSTEEALREIKRRSRERFREAFEAVNRNFGELFAELFGGGRGEMTLIDTQDVLESGIDIIAQPPGKRLQNVLLLSGGEKAMAALALLIAVFRYRPSPFCLLDEVDAPLDEANIGRFTKKIAEMSQHTQFIVITHNKRTMEVARALYGVTMQDAGISKLVSAKFE